MEWRLGAESPLFPFPGEPFVKHTVGFRPPLAPRCRANDEAREEEQCDDRPGALKFFASRATPRSGHRLGAHTSASKALRRGGRENVAAVVRINQAGQK